MAMQFSVTLLNTTNQTVLWNSCVSGAIDSTGKFTAPVVTKKESVCVYAISVADPSKSSTVYTVVTPPVVLGFNCPNRCLSGADPAIAESCWNHTDYALQTVNGKACAWTYPEGEYTVENGKVTKFPQ